MVTDLQPELVEAYLRVANIAKFVDGHRIPVRLVSKLATPTQEEVSITFAAAEMHSRCLVQTIGVTAGTVIAQFINAMRCLLS